MLLQILQSLFKKPKDGQATKEYETATIEVAALTIAIKKQPSKVDKLRYILQHTKKFRVRKKLKKRIKKLS